MSSKINHYIKKIGQFMAATVYVKKSSPTILFPANSKLWKNHKVVVCDSSNDITSEALPGGCKWFFCCLCLPCCSPVKIKEKKGIDLFSEHLNKKYSSSALRTAEIATGIDLAAKREGDNLLLVSEAMRLQERTKAAYEFELDVRARHTHLYFLFHHSEIANSVLTPTPASLKEHIVYNDRNLEDLASLVSAIPLAPKPSQDAIYSITLAFRDKLLQLDTTGIKCLIEQRDRFITVCCQNHGFKIRKPDYFKDLNLIADQEKWWEHFTPPGITEADRTGIQRYSIYLKSQFGTSAVLEAADPSSLPLEERTTLTFSEATRYYWRAEACYHKALFFQDYLFEIYGHVQAILILLLSKENSLTMTRERVLTADEISTIKGHAALVAKLTSTYDLASTVFHIRLYYLCHGDPLSLEGKEEKKESKGSDSESSDKLEEEMTLFSLYDVFQKLLLLPLGYFISRDNLFGVAQKIHSGLKERAISNFDLEKIISDELVNFAADKDAVSASVIRSAKALVQKPTILSRLETRLGDAAYKKFILILRRVTFEKWPQEMYLTLFKHLSGHDRLVSRHYHSHHVTSSSSLNFH